jgi:hypothetical protein
MPEAQFPPRPDTSPAGEPIGWGWPKSRPPSPKPIQLVVLCVVAALFWSAAGVILVFKPWRKGAPPIAFPSVTRRLTVPFPRSAEGAYVSLSISPPERNPTCATHSFGGIPAYYSDCTDWIESGIDPYFIAIYLHNITSSYIDVWERSNFVLTARSGGPFRIVDLSQYVENPEGYIAPSGTLSSHDYATGWLTFTAPPGSVPDSLSFFDREAFEVLTIWFDGVHTD